MPNQSTNIKLTAEISATSKGLVDALKQASHAVNETSSNWKDRFASLKDSTSVIGASVKNLADLISKVGDVQMDVKGMENIKANIAEVSSNFNAVKGEIDSFTAKLVEMKNAASEIGMPIDEYQRFTEAVKASGVQMDEAMTAISTMKQNIADFANGVPEAQQLFSKLGITLEQVSSQGVAANFVAIANAINDTIPASERATQNMNLFKASIDKTLAVAEAYNKTISKQTGTYATDKDVQNAISLSSAIQKLGEQLGSYMSNANGVANANDNAGRSFADLFNIVKTQQNLLSDLYVGYANYVTGLEKTVSSTTNATDAVRIFKDECNRLKNSIQELQKQENQGLENAKVTLVGTEDTKRLDNLLNFVVNAKDKIESEMTAIHGIMNQRIKAGAPIDTQILDEGMKHVWDFRTSLNTLQQAFDSLNMRLPQEAFDSITELKKVLATSQENFRNLKREATEANHALDLMDAANTLSTLNDRLKQVKDTLKSGGKVEIDTSDIDKARQKLESYKSDLSKSTDVKISAEGLEQIRNTVNAIRDSIGDVQGQLAGLDKDSGLKSLDIRLENVQKSLSRLDGGLTTTSELDNNVNQLLFSIRRLGQTLNNTTGTTVEINAKGLDKILADIDKIRESTIEPSVFVNTKSIDLVAEKLQSLKDSAIDSKINLNKYELDDVEKRLSNLKETLLASKVKVDTKEIDALTQRLQTLRETTVGTAIKVDTKEIEKAEGELNRIKNTVISTNVKVDTKELDDATQRLRDLKPTIEVDRSQIDDLVASLQRIRENVVSVKPDTTDLNKLVQDIQRVKDTVIDPKLNLDTTPIDDFRQKIEDSKVSGKIEIREEELDTIKDKLEEIKKTTIRADIHADTTPIDNLKAQFDNLRNEVVNARVYIDASNLEGYERRINAIKDSTLNATVTVDTSVLDRLRNELDTLRETTLQANVNADTSVIDTLKSQLDSLKGTDLNAKVTVDSSTLDNLKAQLDAIKDNVLNATVKADTTQIDSIRTQLDSLKETTLNASVKVDSSVLDRIMSDLDNYKETILDVNLNADTTPINRLKVQLEALKGTSIDTSVTVDSSMIDRLKAQLDSIKETSLNANLNADTSVIDNIKTELDNLKNTTIDTSVAVDSSTLDNLRSQLDGLKNTILNANVNADTTQIDSIKAQLDSLKETTLQANVNADTSVIDTLKSELDSLKSTNVSTTVTVDTSTLDSLRSQLDTLKETTIRANVDANTSALDNLKAELDYYKDSAINAKVDLDATSIEWLIAQVDNLRNTTLNANVNADTTPIDRMRDELDNLKNVSVNAKVTVSQDELDRLAVAIENLRTSVINTNVKVDTTELLNAQSLIQQLKDGDINPKVTVDTAQIDALASRLQEIRDIALAYGVEIDTKTLDNLQKELQKVKDTRVEPKVKVDSRYVDRLRDKINGMKDSVINLTADAQPINNMIAKIDDFKAKVAEANKQASLGTPIWRPITIAMNKVRDIAKGIGTAMRQATSSMEGFKNVVNQTWNGMTRVSTDTTKSGQSIGKILGQATGQVVGMGSAVAIVATAWRNVVKLVKEYCEWLEYSNKMRMYGNASDAADDVKRVNEKQEKKQDDLAKKLTEFADLYDEEKKGSQTARAKRLNLQEELAKQYNFTFDTDRDGNISDLNKQIRTKLEQLRQSELSMIEAALKSNREVANGAQEYIDSFNYLKRLFTFDDEGKIKEAQERRKRSTDEILSLTERKFELQRQNPSQDYQRLRNGKAMDNSNKMIEEERKRAQKAWEERDKALADAKKKLQDWSNSLTDNDRQKAMREIMDKYNEAVKAGVPEAQARIVAEQAIADMLKKEKEAEDKKNKELLDAMNQKIEQYKSAYKEYQNAQNEIRNAQREEAETIRELARENRRERLQKRRERIQQRLATFKFTPYEGFRMNETSTERRKRVNTQKLDASISEKIQRQYEGKTVSWTRQERERFEKYNRLQRKDRQLEAALKQMDAADKQQKAAEALIDASDAIRSAVMDRNEAYKELKKAGTELIQASEKRPTQTVNQNPNWILNEAKRNGLRGRGVSGGVGARQYNYKGELKQLQNELTGIYRNTNNRKTRKDNVNAKAVIKDAKRRYRQEQKGNVKGTNRTGLQARGVTGRIGVRQYNYSQQFDTLHRDLQELNRRVFVVK